MIKLGSLEFKTKKELKEFTRQFLERAAGKTIGIGEIGSHFLLALMDRHPEKATKFKGDIKYFLVTWNFNKKIALSFEDDEGLKSVSWVSCVSGNPSNPLTELKAAMRTAISDQVIKWKRQNYCEGMACKGCDKELWDSKEAQVDHKTKSFEQLFKEFTGAIEKLPVQFRSIGNHLGTTFKDEDFYIKDSWVQYHAQEADYQILCRKCNILKK